MNPSDIIIARAESVASLMRAHPGLPTPSFVIDHFESCDMSAQLEHGRAQVDAWAARLGKIAATRAYTDETPTIGEYGFDIVWDSVTVHVWAQVDIAEITHRVTAQHEVLTSGAEPIGRTTWPDHRAAMAYADAIAASFGGVVIDELCGGCGPISSAERCPSCAAAEVVEDRTNDERASL